MSIDYSKWSKEDLFAEAFRCLDRVNQLLSESASKADALVTRLKTTPYEQLDPRDKYLLNAQLEHEAKMGLI